MVLSKVIIFPVLQKCMCHDHLTIKSVHKIMVALVLQMLRLVILIVLNIVPRHIYLNSSGYNASVSCIFKDHHDNILSSTIGEKWLVFPEYLHYICLLLFIIGIIEFISSQVPYSMKGLMVGVQYTLIAISLIPSVLLLQVFKHGVFFGGTQLIGCGFWYGVIYIIANVIVYITFKCLMKRYKMRKREDVLPNEHIFAERYYSQ